MEASQKIYNNTEPFWRLCVFLMQGAKPLFLFKDFSLWWSAVHTFLELKTNHRFSKDPEHGEMCA